MAQSSPLLKAIGIQEDKQSESPPITPLYLEVAVMHPGSAKTPDKWFVPHITRVNTTLAKRVSILPGFAEQARATLDHAIKIENKLLGLAGRPETEHLKARPYPPSASYFHRIEKATHDLFQRFAKDTNECVLTDNLVKVVRWLFGEFIWNVSRSAPDVNASHMIPVYIVRQKNAGFMQRLEIPADLTLTEMRLVAYYCAVLASGSGFYIYNYEERCLVHNATPEYMALQISWVYFEE